MAMRIQRGLQRGMVAHLAIGAVGELEQARRPAQPLGNPHLVQGLGAADAGSGNQQHPLFHAQVDRMPARGPAVVVGAAEYGGHGLQNEMSMSNALAASSPMAPTSCDWSATNSSRELAGTRVMHSAR